MGPTLDRGVVRLREVRGEAGNQARTGANAAVGAGDLDAAEVAWLLSLEVSWTHANDGVGISGSPAEVTP